MYIQVLKNLMNSNQERAIEVAKKVGISRGALTHWFQKASKEGWVNIETNTLKKLADHFAVEPSLFLKPSPDLNSFKNSFLWDSLYPTMESFIVAIQENQSPALARLVQVVGLENARKIAGQDIIKRFPFYSRYLHPVRKNQLELIWPLYC